MGRADLTPETIRQYIKKFVTVHGFRGSRFTENLSAVIPAQAGLNPEPVNGYKNCLLFYNSHSITL
jgi:hypothetical protein